MRWDRPCARLQDDAAAIAPLDRARGRKKAATAPAKPTNARKTKTALEAAVAA
jgi:hypothetical protein